MMAAQKPQSPPRRAGLQTRDADLILNIAGSCAGYVRAQMRHIPAICISSQEFIPTEIVRPLRSRAQLSRAFLRGKHLVNRCLFYSIIWHNMLHFSADDSDAR